MRQWMFHFFLALLAITCFAVYYFVKHASSYFYIISIASSILLTLLSYRQANENSD
ncbi:hypothetical protein LCY76_08560 [Fictibacillus sp. KIGAM418]|uniref:Uncharacterized protein n=1 Tax=Fictibacillus marinisediminis TaxID=2878389 RepID=A0A9X2BC67_9BACL|nr:hypothetical protein [Fictibacillus marinisediminis]MCK6256644.1 hypothetical protein [Fictibacillus marinisediminis]